MEPPFEFAHGSVQGRDHRLQGRNNQDAFYLLEREDITVAVVCDGCSSGAHSEVGARLGAEYAARVVATVTSSAIPSFFKPEVVSRELAIAFGRPIPQALHGWETEAERRAFMMEHLLFTIVGVAITSESAIFFALGDGIIVVNGEVITLGPFADNAPPYLGYRLLFPHRTHPDIQIIREIPTQELNTFLIGTDGVTHLIASAEKKFPCSEKMIGPLSRLWTEDRFFKNRDMVRRHLSLANQDATQIDWELRTITKELGHLPDDTTLITARRKDR